MTFTFRFLCRVSIVAAWCTLIAWLSSRQDGCRCSAAEARCAPYGTPAELLDRTEATRATAAARLAAVAGRAAAMASWPPWSTAKACTAAGTCAACVTARRAVRPGGCHVVEPRAALLVGALLKLRIGEAWKQRPCQGVVLLMAAATQAAVG